ncbi:hypothetical protein BO153_003533 [Escherichia coli]|nr:hypothetical protein [Escherichia coli]
MNPDLVFESALPFSNIVEYFPVIIGTVVYIACALLNYHYLCANHLKNALADKNNFENKTEQEFWNSESTVKYMDLLRKKHRVLWWVTAIFGIAISSVGVYYITTLGSLRDSFLMMAAFLLSFCIHRTVQICFMVIVARRDIAELKKNISPDFYQVGFSRLAKLERITFIGNFFFSFLGIIVLGWIILYLLNK